MSIKKEVLKQEQGSENIFRFTIPNQTGDFVELTNLGGAISGIHIHKLDGIMENLSPEATKTTSSVGTLLGGELGKSLASKVWDIAEEGENNVFLTCESPAAENSTNTDLKVGLNVTWVNLNRLIVDYFVTPKEKTSFDLKTNLNLASDKRTFLIRSFCPTIVDASGNEARTDKTEYKEMAFVPADFTKRFVGVGEDIKPLVELSDKDSELRISVYSTLTEAQLEKTSSEAIAVSCSEGKTVTLEAGATLANRMIFGFDYVKEVEEDDEEPTIFPFGF